MNEPKSKSMADVQRLFEAETLALQSLMAGANPNPQDELARNSASAKFRQPKHSTALINQLIDCIKSI